MWQTEVLENGNMSEWQIRKLGQRLNRAVKSPEINVEFRQ